jgi:alkaline phosphatase D
MLMSQLPFGSRYSVKIGTYLALYFGSTLSLRQSPSSPPTAIRRTLILASGFYDPSTLFISWLNLSINLLCVLGCLDFVYRIHYLHSAHDLTFCRTGETTATSAKLLCRNPLSNVMTLSFCHPDGNCSDQHTASREEWDHTAVFEIADLAPDTMYLYSASNGHNGSFATTGREDDMRSFTLLSSSCMKPNWPYSPFNHPLKIRGLEDLGSYLSASGKIPEMMLFLGDFICEFSMRDSAKRRFGSTLAD